MQNKKIAPLLIILAMGGTSIGLFFLLNINNDNSGSSGSAAFDKIPLDYVGIKNCVECHEEEYKSWQGSHHDLAMEEANAKTVLGDFNTSFTYYGQHTDFYKKADKFFIRTENADGAQTEFEVKYTFGYYPLQQYLLELPGGRMQTFNVCWDSTPKENGGQKWFHLYPNDEITHDDVLHWTGSFQNWNFMCADCHSTNLLKNFNYESNSYNTTWTDIDVSCEACHGPGTRHVAWVELDKKGQRPKGVKNYGLTVRLKEKELAKWIFEPEKNNAKRSIKLGSSIQIETCARCHSRRTQITDLAYTEQPLLDNYRPSLLDARLYHPDGYILDEVYVWGSFLQSKMYKEGVRCSDCHNAHSLKLKEEGNELCLQCHTRDKYDTPDHHFHKMDQEGASCIECHMAPQTYMVVDPRHEHGFRVPRPDLSKKLNIPNSCTICHKDKDNDWALEAYNKWYPKKDPVPKHFAETFDKAHNNHPSVGDELLVIINDKEQAEIVRATALSLIANYPTPKVVETVANTLGHESHLIRFAALQALANMPPEQARQLAVPLLDDKVRSVRIEAARQLARVSPSQLSADEQKQLAKLMEELIRANMHNADTPQSFMQLGVLYLQKSDIAKAEHFYRKGIDRFPKFLPTYVNLADLLRLQKKDDEGEKVLRNALAIATMERDTADTRHSLGLLLVRQKRYQEGIIQLKMAAQLLPENPQYQYVFAIAAQSLGNSSEAIAVLKKAHERHPYNVDLIMALIGIHRDIGDVKTAVIYVKKLEQLTPGSPLIQQIMNALGAKK